MRIRSAGALLCALACPAALRAQATTALAVRVVDVTDAPVSGALLELVGTRFSALSSDSGWVRLQGLPTGPALLRVSRIGYAPVESTVQLSAAEPFQADVELSRAPVAVSGVAARVAAEEPGLAGTGFYRHRQMGLGTFLTSEDIQRTRAQQTSDVFRHVAGIRVVPTGARGHKLQSVRYGMSMSNTRENGAFSRRRASDGSGDGSPRVCEMMTIVDGVPVRLDDIDDVRLQTVGAIEIYRGPSEIPPEYNHLGAACGVVAMWTRGSNPAPNPSPAP